MKHILIAAVAAAAFSMPATAAVIDFTNIKATWFDPIGGSGITYSGNGTSSASVRWGTSQGQGKSGYDFVVAPLASITVNPPSGSAEGIIGTFTHRNNPISSGTSIGGIKLKFETDVLIDGDAYGNVTFIYDFAHLETPNSATPCANGGFNGFGINNNGCADRVQVNFNSQSDYFTLSEGGIDYNYAVDVIGFLVGSSPVTSFWTREQANNDAQVRGKVVLYSEAVTNGVPEPATWAMLVAGFGLVGAAARRNRSLTVSS